MYAKESNRVACALIFGNASEKKLSQILKSEGWDRFVVINLGCTESASRSSEEGGHAEMTGWEDRDPAVVTLMERRRLLVGESVRFQRLKNWKR